MDKKLAQLILQLSAIALLQSVFCVWAADNAATVEKEGLKVEIKCLDKEIDGTEPLAVEITLANTGDEDIKLLGLKSMRLTVHSADGSRYMEVLDLNRPITTGFYMPVIKAGESRVEKRTINLARLNQHHPTASTADRFSKRGEVVKLVAGDYFVSVEPYFRAFSTDNNDSVNKDLYVGAPGFVKTGFSLKPSK